MTWQRNANGSRVFEKRHTPILLRDNLGWEGERGGGGRGGWGEEGKRCSVRGGVGGKGRVRGVWGLTTTTGFKLSMYTLTPVFIQLTRAE